MPSRSSRYLPFLVGTRLVRHRPAVACGILVQAIMMRPFEDAPRLGIVARVWRSAGEAHRTPPAALTQADSVPRSRGSGTTYLRPPMSYPMIWPVVRCGFPAEIPPLSDANES